MILYALVGGITELLPVSFPGHATILQKTFNIPTLLEGEGCYIRAAISLGTILAVYLSFFREARDSRMILRGIRTRRPNQRTNLDAQLKIRVNLLAVFALIPMFVSFVFLRRAQSLTSLTWVSGLFLVNTLLLILCTRGPEGDREERDVTLFDTLLIGLFRMFAVFPGLSGVCASICIGRARGFSNRFNLRFTYLLTLVYEIGAFLFYLICAFRFGSFRAGLLLPCAMVTGISVVVGYFTLTYFRNMVMNNKLRSFTYYCIDAAAIAFIIAILNA